MAMKIFMLCVLYFAINCDGGKAPFITPCLWSDSGCIVESAHKALPYFKNGLKELGIPPIEPVFIKKAVADVGELKFKVEDMTVVGLGKAKFLEIKRNDAKSTIKVVIVTPLEATGTYEASGKILFLDIEGRGDMRLKTNEIQITVNAKLEKYEKDGKTYYKIAKYDYKYDIKDKFVIELDNLFNGDKKKAEPVLAVIKESSNELVGDIGGPIIEKLMDIKVKEVSNFFTSVPADELELPKQS